MLINAPDSESESSSDPSTTSDSESDSDSSSSSDSDEEITQEYLDSLLQQARENAAIAETEIIRITEDEEEVLKLDDDTDEPWVLSTLSAGTHSFLPALFRNLTPVFCPRFILMQAKEEEIVLL